MDEENMTPFGEALVALLDERGIDLAGLVQRMREDLASCSWWEPPEQVEEIGVEHFREYMTEPDTFAWSRALYAPEAVAVEHVFGLPQDEAFKRLWAPLSKTYRRSWR